MLHIKKDKVDINIVPDFVHELEYAGIVVGVDEAGRGPWAGPVVAAAVNLSKNGQYIDLQGVNDSKKLSAKKRELLFEEITSNFDYAVGVVEVDDIDRINILQATKLAMQKAVSGLKIIPQMVLVDGNFTPELPCDSKFIIKGDAKSMSIAAASIIAKVSRDRIMQDLHQEYPYFAWDSNAGYGTKAHKEGLASFGVTKHHRKSYAPIKKLL